MINAEFGQKAWDFAIQTAGNLRDWYVWDLNATEKRNLHRSLIAAPFVLAAAMVFMPRLDNQQGTAAVPATQPALATMTAATDSKLATTDRPPVLSDMQLRLNPLPTAYSAFTF